MSLGPQKIELASKAIEYRVLDPHLNRVFYHPLTFLFMDACPLIYGLFIHWQGPNRVPHQFDDKRIRFYKKRDSIKILSWNIQEGKKPQTLSELIYLKNKYKSDIIFVIQTLTNNANSKRILKTLQFYNNIIIDPINHTGGIWVCWNNNHINLKNQVTHDLLNYKFYTNPPTRSTLLYGPTAFRKILKNMLFGHISINFYNKSITHYY